MEKPETHVVTEDAVRPAGNPGECFYCHRPLGEQHVDNCVIRVRTVVVRLEAEVVIRQPASWTPKNINWHKSDSSWCADNAIDWLTERPGCLCGKLKVSYVREATAQDEELLA